MLAPTRPEETIDEETKRILIERDKSFEKDKETAVDAREALQAMRKNLKTLSPH